jgi:prolyl 4-hydroxylase
MKEHKINKKEFVRGYYIDEKICDDLIELFNLNKHIAVQGGVGQKTGAVINFKKKKCIEMFIETGFPDVQPYLKALDECKKLYLKEFSALKDNVKLQKYSAPQDGYFFWHSERDGDPMTVKRLLVYMTYLNTVKKGGHTEFLYQKLKIKPEKGLTLIWPADFTHTHRGNVVEEGDKYIATGWYCYFDE